MFRHPLRSSLRFLMALLAAGAATSARAQVDLEDVIFTVVIARSTEGADVISAEVRVQGTDINNATIALPSNPGVNIPLDMDGADFVADDTFDSEAALNAVFSSGNYLLRLNNGTVQVTIPYARPGVPSPAISQPSAGSVIAPGAVELLFTSCPICIQSGDSTEAVLEDDAMNVLASDTLLSTDESWTPSDGMGGDLLLGEAAAFVARITHTAVRENTDIPVNDADDLFLFTHRFVQSDEIGFETGFAPPMGVFCIAVNHPLPDPGCAVVNDPLRSLLDTSGLVSTQVAGLDVDYDIDVSGGGAITGMAMADLDDDGSKETLGEVKGKLKGRDGEAQQKLSFGLESMLPAKLKVSVSDELSIPGDSLARLQRASGSIGGTKIKEEDASNVSPLPIAAQGFMLSFELDGTDVVQNASLELEGGRSFALTGTNKFDIARDLSTAKLSSDDGVRIQLKKLGLDETMDPTVTEGSMSYRALGQSGAVTIP